MGGVPQSFPSITNCAEEAAAGVREKETDTETCGGGVEGVSEKRDATLSPFPSFLNTAQSSGSGEQSERCGTYSYSKSPDGADLNQPPPPPTINTAENQQTRGIISSGICCGQPLWAGGTLPASVIRISPLNSSTTQANPS